MPLVKAATRGENPEGLSLMGSEELCAVPRLLVMCILCEPRNAQVKESVIAVKQGAYISE